MWLIPNNFLIPSIVLSKANEQIDIMALQQSQGNKTKLYLRHMIIKIVCHYQLESQQRCPRCISYLFC